MVNISRMLLYHELFLSHTHLFIFNAGKANMHMHTYVIHQVPYLKYCTQGFSEKEVPRY